ncbi:MAG: glycosyltransferase [Proteobacteria bacterium]|nr:glycosyltransferase [Pseudomonadota bacterium]
MSIVSSQLAARGHDVALLTWDPVKADFYPLHERVMRIEAPLARRARGVLDALRSNWIRMVCIRAAAQRHRADVLVSFMTDMNVLTIAATFGTRVRAVISERVHPGQYSPGLLWKILRRGSYWMADALVMQTAAGQRWFARRWPRPNRIRVIPNPCFIQIATHNRQSPNSDDRYVCAIGRLVPQKGFDVLLRAFVEVLPLDPRLALVIIGVGPELQRLARLASELGIAERVRWAGAVGDVEPMLRGAEFLVSSSRFEGFPNVILEALACGCPVISTDCETGPKEILGGTAAGLLVPVDDVRALSGAMRQLLLSSSLRREMSAAASLVVERFAVNRIVGAWEELICEVSSVRGVRR